MAIKRPSVIGPLKTVPNRNSGKMFNAVSLEDAEDEEESTDNMLDQIQPEVNLL